MENKPTGVIYLVQDTKKTDAEGRNRNFWHRIGVVFPTKTGNGSNIVWTFDPVPTNGRMFIMPYEDEEIENVGNN